MFDSHSYHSLLEIIKMKVSIKLHSEDFFDDKKKNLALPLIVRNHWHWRLLPYGNSLCLCVRFLYLRNGTTIDLFRSFRIFYRKYVIVGYLYFRQNTKMVQAASSCSCSVLGCSCNVPKQPCLYERL